MTTNRRRSARNMRVDELMANPGNVRANVGDVSELARSVKQLGILSPLLANPDGLLLAGHRRLAAAKAAGLTHVPVFVHHDVTDADEVAQVAVMLAENVQRQQLTPVEKARAYGRLRKAGLSNTDIARETGIAVSSITNHLALLELDDASLKRVEDGKVPTGTAIAAVREQRQDRRAAAGTPPRGRPAIVEATHFGADHPLIAVASSICSHSTRPQVGKSGVCGQCWETTIRCDALGQPLPPATYDEVIVERILGGANNVQAAPPDRVEVVRRWTAAGRDLTELRTRTGWVVERYVLPATTPPASSPVPETDTPGGTP